MLRIYYSTDLESLARQLLEDRRERKAAHPLAPEIFLVQNHGMARWLTLYLGRREGIAANLKFEFPAERIWSMARTIYPEIPDLLPSEKGPMSWEIFDLLGNGGGKIHRSLRHYTERGGEEGSELRRWQLARSIADVFDQYLVYRPGLLLGWERGDTVYGGETEVWQEELWRALVERWKRRLGEKPWLHRARLHLELEHALEDGRLSGEQLPERLTLFGVSDMPPPIIRLLVQCSKESDVVFYQRRSREEGSDVLAESWGTSERDFTALLEEAGREAKISHLPAADRDENGQLSLLGTLRSSVRYGKRPEAGNVQWDDSVEIHSCHSELREMEVLRDRLLAILDRRPDIGPGNILVVNPDMEQYAPLIDSVFGPSEEGLPDIPYSIERPGTESRAMVESFHALLELVRSRFKASEVLDFLEKEPVKDAFGLTDDQFDRIERWAEENRIRWGIDGAFKNSLDLPPENGHTWTRGLERMVYGYAMQGEGDRLYEEIYPYDGVGQSDEAILLGTVSRALNRLFEMHRYCRESHTPGEWAKFLKRAVDFFLDDSGERARHWSAIASVIDRIPAEAERAGFGGDVSFGLVADWMEGELEAGGSSGNPFGGVTFSRLIPVRNIPFKVICLTGMNDGVFPRRKSTPAFDLIRREPRRGDRSRLEEDRQIMLETVTSAGQKLYVSYQGQSNRQEADWPPSVVVSELLDHLAGLCGLTFEEAEKKIVKHRLQPFSPRYFSAGKEESDSLFSYSERHRRMALSLLEEGNSPPFFEKPLPEPEESGKPYPLRALADFFAHPARTLLRERLGLYLEDTIREEDDREPFELGALDRYGLGEEMLERFLEGGDPGEIYRRARAADHLPPGWAGEESFLRLEEEVCRFGEALKPHLDDRREEPLHFQLETSAGNLSVKLEGIHGNGRVRYRFGSRRKKHLAELWIAHLSLQMAGEDVPRRSFLLSREKGGRVGECRLEPVEEPLLRMEELMRLCREGMRRPLPFFPECSFAYAEEMLEKGGDHSEALNKARNLWKNENIPYPMEGDDPYNRRAHAGRDPFGGESFPRLAITFWKPLLKHLTVID